MDLPNHFEDRKKLSNQIFSSKLIRDLIIFICGITLGAIAVSMIKEDAVISKGLQTAQEGDTSLSIPMSQFPEPAWRTKSTLAVRTIASTPFARFEIHKVLTDSGIIIDDWLWTDERSHINILVHLKNENKYLLFKQKKYGLEREYYALIGGLFNEGETGLECAQRELLEETGLEAEEMIDLGRYRVQVNRGGGILYAYYAKNSFKSNKLFKHDNDYEKQAHLKLSRDELIDITLSGEIGEAQWVACAALGLLYEEHKEDHPDHASSKVKKSSTSSSTSIAKKTKNLKPKYEHTI